MNPMLLSKDIPTLRKEILALLKLSGIETSLPLNAAYSQQISGTSEQGAACDLLLNLPNRLGLYHILQETIAAAKRTQQTIAILVIGLDYLLGANSPKEAVKQSLRQQVVERLQTFLWKEDVITWLDEDEFGVILKDMTSMKEVSTLSQKLLNSLSQPYSFDGQRFQLLCSIGATAYPQDNRTPEVLVRHANIAMHHAKRREHNSYQLYKPGLTPPATQQQSMEMDLDIAISRGELQLYYQPQVNLANGRIMSAEALLRWQHPRLGSISPNTFIPIAEMTGLIEYLEEWVLRKACQQTKSWQSSSSLPIFTSINLTSYHFRQQTLIEMVERILQKTALEPCYLSIEVSEADLVENFELVLPTLQSLKKMGLQLCIDNFGMNLASLQYLEQLPIDTLKVSQSFIRNVVTAQRGALIMTKLVAIAHLLNLKVVAKEVESNEQLIFLRQQGFDAIQGYLYSPPVLGEVIQQLLQQA
jgi:diguanylate cyclase